MNGVTRLDQVLYAWLAEPDDAKFERAFQRYYDLAFTGVVRYLGRRSTATRLDLEQIAVDALLKFFSRVGRERRAAAASIKKSLPELAPPDFGAMHIRQVRRWSSEVGSFHDTSLGFTIDEDIDNRNWKAEIDALIAQISPLQRQGCHLVDPIRSTAMAVVQVQVAARDSADGDSDGDGDGDGDGDTDDFPGLAPTREFAGLLAAGGAATAALDGQHPGAVHFVAGAWRIVESLPALRVPTNGYLFDIAQSLYLDECKAMGRQKRGGAGATGAAPEDASHPLAQLTLDDDGERAAAPLSIVISTEWSESTVHPETEQIGEEFCEKFYAYLRRPLTVAEQAYQVAAAAGSSKAEAKRLESIARKTDRVLAVLAMRIEGQTQEEIAEVLDISRNQVKYIVELVQEAYEQFVTVCSRTPQRPSAAGGLSHVQ